jgi:serine/threonine protein kinase
VSIITDFESLTPHNIECGRITHISASLTYCTMDVISLSSGNKLAGRYRVLQKLGEGSFAETFLAEDEHLPDAFQCVIKKLKTGVEDEAKLKIAKRLFDEEARTLHQLGSHPNIPQLLAHFEENNEFYLVEEYVEGSSLYQELAAGQQWSESYVTKLLKDILKALSFVHQKQVIHRDIKPSNIIRRNSDGQIVLIDFGAVKQVANQTLDDSSQIAAHTVIVGTPGYMPGEQLRGSPRMSSDVYAVGMIGIYALTGLNPALGQLPEDEATAEILWRDRTSISEEFASILEKMVAYDFRQRYPSAKEALDALNALAFYQQDNSPTILKDGVVSVGVPMGSGITISPDRDSSSSFNIPSGNDSSARPVPTQGPASSGIIINGGGSSGIGGSVAVNSGLEPTSIGPFNPDPVLDSSGPSNPIRASHEVASALEPTSISPSEPTSAGTYVISNARPADISKPVLDSPVKPHRGFPVKILALGGAAVVAIGAIAALASPNIEPICKTLNNCSANIKYGSVYKEASNSAESALSVINNAKSVKDLKGAQTQLQQSILALSKVPKNVDSYADAQKLLPNYQKQLKNLQEKVIIETKAQQDLQQAKTLANKVLTQKKPAGSLTVLTNDRAKLQQAIQRVDKIPSNSLSATQRQTERLAYLQKSKELDIEIQKQVAAEAAAQRQREAATPQSSGWSGSGGSSSGGREPLWGSGSGSSGGSSAAPPPPAVWNSGGSSVAQEPAPAPAAAPREPLWGGGGGSQQAAPPPSKSGGGDQEPLW